MEIGDKINVLDHGFVRLVSCMGSDLSIVRAARVSYAADWRTGQEGEESADAKLIAYLIRNKHTSPFESVVFTFEIKCPIFIARQWHRHRTWSYNEVSARYTQLPNEFYIPEIAQITTQSKDNKQMRTEEIHMQAETFRMHMTSMMRDLFREYNWFLEQGMPRELARAILPMSTYTRFFGTVNLHNLFHFLELRLHPHAQWEIREYAQALASLITPIIPISMRYWSDITAERIYKVKQS